jgi:hypothetical protein
MGIGRKGGEELYHSSASFKKTGIGYEGGEKLYTPLIPYSRFSKSRFEMLMG